MAKKVVEVEYKVKSGKELTRKLKATGTGLDKLEACRAVLRADPAAPSEAVIAALEAGCAAGAPWSGTVAKAKEIAETGEWLPVKADAPNVEDFEDEPAPVKAPEAKPKKPAAE